MSTARIVRPACWVAGVVGIYLVAFAVPALKAPLLPGLDFGSRWLFQLETDPYSLAHYLLAIGVFLWAISRVGRGALQKNEVEDSDTRKPNSIQRSGLYAELRHPMYGAFIFMLWCGLGCCHSYLGVILAGAFSLAQAASAIFEERRELLVHFPSEYQEYAKAVPNRFFSDGHRSLLTVLVLIAVLEIHL
jgi:protein-S-isoprenylcysteine O-methyltransferase Ste14